MIIKLVLLKLDKLGDGERHRYQSLHDELYRFTRAGKLLCPEAGQPTEVWAERSSFLDALYELSLGVRTRVKPGIEEAQVQRLMAAHIAGDAGVTLLYADAFPGDPLRKAQESLTSRYIVAVDMGFLATVDNIRAQRGAIHRDWEALRQRCVQGRVTYDEQLRRERVGGIDAVISMARDCVLKTIRNEEPTQNEIGSHLNLCHLASTWDFLRGKPPGVEGLMKFLRSPYYASVPSVDISAMLVASLMVGSKRIEHGDAIDIDHISSMLPYVDLLLVDKRMKNRVRGLGLDRKYGTLVCYIGDGDEIGAFFRKVEQCPNYIVTSPFDENYDG